ncbi:MAG: flagellar motor protein MotB, partial [Spirosomataceae bacterium]
MARFATNPQIHADSLEKTVDVFLKFLSFRGTRNLPPSLLLFLYFFLALYSSIFAQNRSSAFLTPSQNESVQKPATTNKKAQQAFEKSTKFYAEKNFAMAAAWVDEALKNDSVFAEAHFRKAQLYEIFTQPELALQSYRKAIVLRPEAPSFVFAYQKLIDYHLREGQYAQAKRDLERYIPLLKPNSIAQKRAERQLRTCEYGEKAMLNPLIINPEELSDTVNKYLLQYFPSLTADGETLLFTALNESNDEDLFLTTYQNGSWQKPVAISDKINTNENEGTGALSADGRTLVFTACNRRDGYGSCDLYISHKVGNDWEKPKNLGIEINSHFWDSQPTLSPDGQTLYFVSDRKGGIGGRDVWYSTLNSKGQWTPARNIGDVVNTVDDEASPFMHANGHTLFFASEGHEGLGGYDLFYADSTLTGWQKPRNLGYPINNAENQVALVITADGKYGYYSYDTKKPGVQRMSKIYRFLIPNQLKKQFNVVNSLKGVVTDSKTQK